MKEKRDLSVELLRIFACIIVVGTHSKLSNYFTAEGMVNNSTLFIADFFGEGVGIFFIIMGFFYFNNKSFANFIKKVTKSLIIPTFAVILITQLLYFYVNNSMSILESVSQFDLNIREIVEHTVSWSLGSIRGCGHLGFVCTYFQCVLWFPLVFHLANTDNTKYRRFVIILGMISVFLADLQRLYKSPIGTIKGYELVPISMLMVIIGYEIYNYRDKLKGNIKVRTVGLLVYFGAHCANFLCNKYILNKSPNGTRFVWYNFWQIISAIAISIVAMTIVLETKNIERLITYIGKRTMWIYLLHAMVITKIKANGLYSMIYDKLVGIKGGLLEEVVFTCAITLFVFVTTLGIIILYDVVKVIYKKIKNKRSEMVV